MGFVGGFSIAYTSSEKVTAFNSYFSCNSEIEDTNAEAPPYSHEPGLVLCNITATSHDVLDILQSLDTSKAT